MSDPFKPSPALLCKLGSVVVHVEEMRSPDGHAFDTIALDGLLKDPEVVQWLARMNAMAMLPRKRSVPPV